MGGPWGPPSRRHLTGEDECLAPTHCLDKRVIACLCGAVWLAYIHFQLFWVCKDAEMPVSLRCLRDSSFFWEDSGVSLFATRRVVPVGGLKLPSELRFRNYWPKPPERRGTRSHAGSPPQPRSACPQKSRATLRVSRQRKSRSAFFDIPRRE